MKFDTERLCIVNDDGSLIKPLKNGCRGHSSGIGNKYKCSSASCGGDFKTYLLRELYGISPRRKAEEVA